MANNWDMLIVTKMYIFHQTSWKISFLRIIKGISFILMVSLNLKK